MADNPEATTSHTMTSNESMDKDPAPTGCALPAVAFPSFVCHPTHFPHVSFLLLLTHPRLPSTAPTELAALLNRFSFQLLSSAIIYSLGGLHEQHLNPQNKTYKGSDEMANSIASKEELACLPTLEGNVNYPLWSLQMRNFMKNKDLWTTITVAPVPNPAQAVKKQLNNSAGVIAMKLSDRLFVDIVKEENDDSGYLSSELKNKTQTTNTPNQTGKEINWQNVRYKGHMLNFLDDVQRCLTNFASIGHPMQSRDICSYIIGKLGTSRRALNDSFALDPEMNNNHLLLMD
ncbi:hypothetical protein PTTG_09190 [Puccinia triticina 1-1 BBBD Race 1]|uniref:DUF4219 domain-containing protein n=1 Tax=Puccinia triticina (isolate 1-1 / race 1 (BBBD)) TaxID=630390 RepID=A0A180GTA0_PUCT1|nr:hypothetical protein PTTG_09190 [Puccinia triticina 1-1 BBBD Race 1]